MTILRTEKVGFQYNGRWVLRDISFEVGEGEFVGIIGPNGSGKTTLLKILDGILTPREGRVMLRDQDIARLNRETLAKVIGVVPQDYSMFFPFSVEEIVLMGRTPHLGLLRFEGRKDFAIARRAMELTETTEFRRRGMGELSGGERQRVLIARAVTQEPQILLLDEPTTYLDIKHQVALFQLMKTLHEQGNLTVIVVTQDINLAAQYCHRILLIKNGRSFSMGTPAEVVTEENIRQVYETHVLIDPHPRTGLPRVTLI
ncbi:MAG TPA: ABC transporter ATP-binding protein [Syntrophales bacterium]|jgi:iron complex transport system ATP-binding protein|nr:ABC transporter ATP-binding protein [Syntrophales bacterium]HRT62426.1 ABC transporter ATP-binding protein [Syntrophales bacterium]